MRREVARVTWPTRKETIASTGMVFVFVIMAALFFFFLDQILAYLVKLIFQLGG